MFPAVPKCASLNWLMLWPSPDWILARVISGGGDSAGVFLAIRSFLAAMIGGGVSLANASRKVDHHPANLRMTISIGPFFAKRAQVHAYPVAQMQNSRAAETAVSGV